MTQHLAEQLHLDKDTGRDKKKKKNAREHCPGDGASSSSGTDGFLKIKEICSGKVTQGLK